VVVLCKQPLAQERWGKEGLGGRVRMQKRVGVQREGRGVEREGKEVLGEERRGSEVK
jgi:hypothetical protein